MDTKTTAEEVEKEKKVDKLDEDRNTKKIIGLAPDEEEPASHVERAKTAVGRRRQRPKDKDEDSLQARKIESYSSEEEDLDGPKKETVEVEVHRSSSDEPSKQKKDKKKKNRVQKRHTIGNENDSESDYSSSSSSSSSSSKSSRSSRSSSRSRSRSSRSSSRSRSRSPSPVRKASPEPEKKVSKEEVVPVEQSMEKTNKLDEGQLEAGAPKINDDAASREITEPETSFLKRITDDNDISKPGQSASSSSKDSSTASTNSSSSPISGSTKRATPTLRNTPESQKLETSKDVSKADDNLTKEKGVQIDEDENKVPEPFAYIRKRDSYIEGPYESIPEPFLYKKKSEMEIKVILPDDSGKTESGSNKKGSESSESQQDVEKTPASETPTKQITDLASEMTSDMLDAASKEMYKIENQNVQSANQEQTDSSRESSSRSESGSESESESGSVTGTKTTDWTGTKTTDRLGTETTDRTGTETTDRTGTKTESKTETDNETKTETGDEKSAEPLRKRVQELASEKVDTEEIQSTQKLQSREQKKESLTTETETETEGTADSSSDGENSSGSSIESESETDDTARKRRNKKEVDYSTTDNSNSNSEDDATYGGNDPDNVAEGTKTGSQLVKNVVNPGQPVECNISQMVRGKVDVELNSIALSQEQVTELVDNMGASMKTLSLRNCGLADWEFSKITDAVIASKAEPLMLNLNLNKLGPSSATRLGAILLSKPSIKTLLLQGNSFGDDGIKLLVDGLLSKGDANSEWWSNGSSFRDIRADEVSFDPMTTRIQLQELDIGNTRITDRGMNDISRLLEQNPSLTSLNLNGNKDVTITGWKRLAKALKENKTLETLSLDFNRIGNDGISVLAAGLRDNEKLKHLDLEDVGLTEEGGRSLLSLLKCNTTILDLTASPGNAISRGLLEDMRKYLALNNTVVH